MATLLNPSSSGAPAARALAQGAAARHDRWFYPAMAVAIIVVEAIGFGHSERARLAGHHPLRAMVVVHVALFTGWLALFFVQTMLVATGRTRLHRGLGVLAATVAATMIATAPPLAIDLARRGVGSSDPPAFLLVMLVDLLAFATFVGLGIWFRRRPEKHKRLMLLATTSLVPAGVSRWPIATTNPGPVIIATMLAMLAAPLLRDRWMRRSLDPASLWGGLALLLSVPIRFAIAFGAPWHRAAQWLMQ